MTMQRDRIHQGSGRSVSLKRLLTATAALPVAVAGMMMAFAAETPANAHDYTISPTVFGFTGGTTETLSGVFSFSGSTLSSVDLTLSGDGPGVAGVYDSPDPLAKGANFFFASNASTGVILLEFAAALAGQPDDIATFAVGSGCIHLVGCPSAAAGVSTGASAVPAVPEPSSLALLGTALAFFRFKRRSTQRR